MMMHLMGKDGASMCGTQSSAEECSDGSGGIEITCPECKEIQRFQGFLANAQEGAVFTPVKDKAPSRKPPVPKAE
jgi:hypothetical protein